jgi:hypothetical protein
VHSSSGVCVSRQPLAASNLTEARLAFALSGAAQCIGSTSESACALL